MRQEILRMERVTVTEQGRELLNNFNFQMFKGEVMGLVPLDSYGLEEFVDCLQNNRPLLYGRVYLREKLVNTYAGQTRSRNNVYMISKSETLIDSLPGADNVFLIRKGYKGFWIKDRLIRRQLMLLLEESGVEINPAKKVSELTTLEKDVIGIAKAAVAKADLVILRDVGSSLWPEDKMKLDKVIRGYARKGLSFIYISTKPEELSRFCDRVSVMSHGRIIKVLEKEEIAENLEKHYFFPYQLLKTRKTQEEDQGEKVFRCEKMSHRSIRNMTFDVGRGEGLLIHDYNNVDWKDFIDVLSGAKPQSGSVWWKGKEKDKEKRKIGVILENPAETMLYPEMSYEDNLCLCLDDKVEHLWRSRKKRKSIAREVAGREITCKVKDLSLEEKYNLIYHKILLQKPEIIFCFFPYRNVDVNLQRFINTFLKRYLAKGIAVVIITMDVMDGVSIADRILLFGKNESRLIFDRKDFEQILSDRKKPFLWKFRQILCIPLRCSIGALRDVVREVQNSFDRCPANLRWLERRLLPARSEHKSACRSPRRRLKDNGSSPPEKCFRDVPNIDRFRS